ncbi:MAG: hypothetical protein RL634_1712, partial [Bacteroidota bacterium]
MELLTIILLVLILAGIILLVVKKSPPGQAGNEGKIAELERSLSRIEQSLKEDFRINREESNKLAKENRTELTDALLKTGKDQAEKLEALIAKIEEKNKEMRDLIEKAFRYIAENFDKNVKSFNDLQREKFAQLEERQNKLVEQTEKKLEQMRETVDE